MKLVFFKRFNEFNHFDNNASMHGKAFGIFFVSLFYKKEVYGNSCYADKPLDKLKWWQRILHKDILNKYILYTKGEYTPEDLGYGEWGGIVPWRVRFPICFSSELYMSIDNSDKCHEIKTMSFKYGCIDHRDITILTDKSFTKIHVTK